MGESVAIEFMASRHDGAHWALRVIEAGLYMAVPTRAGHHVDQARARWRETAKENP